MRGLLLLSTTLLSCVAIDPNTSSIGSLENLSGGREFTMAGQLTASTDVSVQPSISVNLRSVGML